jgi:hypothetical protein
MRPESGMLLHRQSCARRMSSVTPVAPAYGSPVLPHRQVAEIIRGRIRSGELGFGEGLITIVRGWGSFVKE